MCQKDPLASNIRVHQNLLFFQTPMEVFKKNKMAEAFLLAFAISALFSVEVSGKGSKMLDMITQNPHIWGGKFGADGQFPYSASYQIKGTYYYEHACTGTIVSPNKVLTAAHCVTSDISRVVAGSNKILEINWGPHVQFQLVREAMKHPDFGEIYPSPNDIAILFLKGRFLFNEFVSAIYIPVEDHKHKIEPAIVTGWGEVLKSTGEMPGLQYVTVDVIRNEECGKALKAIINSTLTIGGDTICSMTNKNEKGKHPCGGEGGSPLVQDELIIGIASWTLKPCNKENIPMVYTRVSKFVKFLDEAIAINYRKQELEMGERKDNGANKNYHCAVAILIIITAIIL